MIKCSNDGTVFASVYMDDNFCAKHTKALKIFVEDLKKQGLTVKVSEKLTDYLSCTIKFSQDRKSTWVGQPHLIAKLHEKFGYLVTKIHHRDPQTESRIIPISSGYLALSGEVFKTLSGKPIT